MLHLKLGSIKICIMERPLDLTSRIEETYCPIKRVLYLTCSQMSHKMTRKNISMHFYIPTIMVEHTVLYQTSVCYFLLYIYLHVTFFVFAQQLRLYTIILVRYFGCLTLGVIKKPIEFMAKVELSS
ncbi:hypothetical protein CHS0354_021735 [Potamilus streckersoni]|uniref:Uncharacterized protein n=1 Tax=Potamilus streckersoni TaxID=2493646 RepID=A0AAE0TKF8_9BIVA|nr:hypothetical protein CHS0354_021735 [Potamilus streckersoni]